MDIQKLEERQKRLQKQIKEAKKAQKMKERKALNHLKMKIAEEFYYFQKLKAEEQGLKAPSLEDIYKVLKQWTADLEEKIRQEEEQKNILDDFDIDDILEQ